MNTMTTQCVCVCAQGQSICVVNLAHFLAGLIVVMLQTIHKSMYDTQTNINIDICRVQHPSTNVSPLYSTQLRSLKQGLNHQLANSFIPFHTGVTAL